MQKDNPTSSPETTEIVKEEITEASLDSHSHEWELILKTFAHPKQDVAIDNAGNIDKDTLDKMLFGITTLLWACIICKETKESEVLGSDEDQLSEILEKANLYGPQYLQKDGQTYIIAKYQAQTPSPAQNLPVR